jgi:hypothetical protein
MKNISKFLSISFTLSCLLIAPSIARATPTAGTNELRIDGSYLIPGYSITGYNHTSTSSPNTPNSTSMTLFGVGFAVGRFLTDNLEIGTTLNLYYSKGTGSATTTPGIAPFVRGFAMVADHVGAYCGATAGIQRSSQDNAPDQTGLMLGADLGAEFFLADSRPPDIRGEEVPGIAGFHLSFVI